MKIDLAFFPIVAILLAGLLSTCSVKRKGECYACFNSSSNIQQAYLDANQASFILDASFNPDSKFKIVLAQSRDLIDTVEEADIAASNDEVRIVSDWSTSMDLALLEGLLPDQTYAWALLEKNKFERIRIMEIKEFTTQSADSPKAAGLPKVLQVKKEEATIVFPSALDDKTIPSEMNYLVAVWKKELGYSTKEAILQNSPGISVVQDWTQGTDQEFQELQVRNLEVETDYVIGILARDSDGNVTLMPLRSLKTLDQSAPDADAISSISSTESSVTLSWPQAQDQETSADRLEYRVLLAGSLNSLESPELMNTVESSSIEPKLVQDWTPDLKQLEVTGLSVGRKYHFAVIVRDLGKNLASYRTLSITLSDPNAPAFPDETLELTMSSTGYTYPDGVQVIHYGSVNYKPSIALDSATPADEIEYLAACSLDASALTSLETIQNNLSKVTKSGWQKPVFKQSSYSISLHRYDEQLIETCRSHQYLEWMGTYIYSPHTPELKSVSPSSYSNICRTLQSYEIEPQYVLKRVNVSCKYSGVAGKMYGKVFARDAEGKMASVGPQLLAYSWDKDAPRFAQDPVLTGDDTMTWAPATDYFTTEANIEYKLVVAASSQSIDSVEEVSAIASAADGLVLDWTPNITSTKLNIPLTGSSYSLVLAARDELGNIRLATALSLVDEGPQAGSAPSLSAFVFNSLLLSWGAATDDKTAAGDLFYKVVRADSATDLDTVAEANARSSNDVLLDWTKAVTSHELTGSQLSAGALAILVRDSVGQITLYDPVTRSQTVDSLQLYFDSGNTASYPGTGTTWKDLSGNGFDSTLYGGVAFVTSDGGAFDFDGVDDYVLLGNLSALKPTAAVSISQWLAPDNWTGLLEYKVSISCTQGSGYAINVHTNNTIQFQIWVNGAYRTAAASTVGFTGWKHVVGQFDGRYTKIYINGTLIHTVDVGANYPVTYIQNGVLIGAEATSNNTPHTLNWWAGKIGPTLIRSRAMSDAEVLAEFNSSKGRFGL